MRGTAVVALMGLVFSGCGGTAGPQVGPLLGPIAPRPGPASEAAGFLEAEACTAFVLRDGQHVLAGKNLDWPVGEGAVLLNPRGLANVGLVAAPESPARWVARYASVSFNQLGRGFPLGGMNEAGLVVEELSYGPARYPDPGGRPALSELQWIQYQLDTHRTVGDVVADTAIRIAPLLFGLHYLVADAAGDVAVVEFLEGERVVYTGPDLPVAVLANDTYRNLVRYLGMHAGFGGERVAGPGPESPERFVRAATRVRRLEAAGGVSVGSPVDAREPDDIDTAADRLTLDRAALTDSAFAILADVAQDDTQWSIVYDPIAREVRYRTLADPGIRSARVGELPGDCAGGALGRPIAAGVDDAMWRPWTDARNRALLDVVFDALAGTGGLEVPDGVKAGIVAHAAIECAGGS